MCDTSSLNNAGIGCLVESSHLCYSFIPLLRSTMTLSPCYYILHHCHFSSPPWVLSLIPPADGELRDKCCSRLPARHIPACRHCCSGCLKGQIKKGHCRIYMQVFTSLGGITDGLSLAQVICLAFFPKSS